MIDSLIRRKTILIGAAQPIGGSGKAEQSHVVEIQVYLEGRWNTCMNGALHILPRLAYDLDSGTTGPYELPVAPKETALVMFHFMKNRASHVGAIQVYAHTFLTLKDETHA